MKKLHPMIPLEKRNEIISMYFSGDTIPTEKEHLSRQELVNLANTPCSSEVLKKAFLFSCLTGLRKSDIKQLIWDI